MRKIIALAAAATLGVNTPALAESFSGPYVGAELSRDSYQINGDNLDLGIATASASGLGADGIAGGVFAGYDLRLGGGFVGVEANFDYSGAKLGVSGSDGVNTAEASVKARESYGVSGRAGLLVNDNTGLYAKLGWRATRFKSEAIENGTSLFADTRTKSAFVYGAGLETSVSEKVSVRVEYTVADYRSAGLNADFGVTGISVKNGKVAFGVTGRF